MKTEMKSELENRNPMMTPQAFAVLGGGKIAYVKSINSEDVHRPLSEAPAMQPGYVVCAATADGRRSSSPTRRSGGRNARTHELETVSVISALATALSH